MRPHAVISHSSPGRVRFRVPSKRYDHEFFHSLRKFLNQHELVNQVVSNLASASVLILHSAETQVILDWLGHWLELKTEESSKKSEASSPSPLLLPGLIGLGVIQLLRGQPLAPSSALFMDAYRLWLTSGRERS